ncbi:MAG: tungstate ABC transporter substrate-binding protein WtpA [Thermoleophilia bacterium]
MFRQLPLLFLLLLSPALLSGVAGCSDSDGQGAGADTGADTGGEVSVLYAGSLVRLMEEYLGPAFEEQTGIAYSGEGKGSVAGANLILDSLRRPDVFISADPAVNQMLLEQDAAVAPWYVTFAATELVLAYSPQGRHAEVFARARRGEVSWHEALRIPGLRLGRSDPDLDPAGYRAVFALELAEEVLGLDGLKDEVFGSDRNPAQIFPEEDLAARLEAGQLDAVLVYRSVAVPHGLPFVELPPEVGQGDPELADLYATRSYTNSRTGKKYRGAPVVYTVTVGNDYSPEAVAFAAFLLGGSARPLLEEAGLSPVTPRVGGDPEAVPAEVRGLLSALEVRSWPS